MHDVCECISLIPPVWVMLAHSTLPAQLWVQIPKCCDWDLVFVWYRVRFQPGPSIHGVRVIPKHHFVLLPGGCFRCRFVTYCNLCIVRTV